MPVAEAIPPKAGWATPYNAAKETRLLAIPSPSGRTQGEQQGSACNVNGLLRQIESAISEHLSTSDDPDVNRYLLAALGEFAQRPGKRLRPLLCLLACELVGGRAKHALSAAVAFELFHVAALIHDDVEDNGVLRRGKPAFHRAEGTPIAVNSGDYGLVLTYRLILDDPHLDEATRLAVVKALTDMAELTIRGQAVDLGWSRDSRFDITVDDYIEMARDKSAYYSCSFPLSIGSLIGGGSARQQAILHEIGNQCGIAFQVEDDLSNLLGNPETGKDAFSDITEGKRTLMVAYALAHSPHADELACILGAHVTDRQHIQRALQLMRSCGALEYASFESRRMCRRAIALLRNTFKENDARRELEKIIVSIPSAWKGEGGRNEQHRPFA